MIDNPGFNALSRHAFGNNYRPVPTADRIHHEWIRTTNLRFRRPMTNFNNNSSDDGLRIATSPVSHHIPTDSCHRDPDLTAVIQAWDRLPEAIKAGIMAMVNATTQVMAQDRG